MAESNKTAPDSRSNDDRVEALAKDLAERLRAMPNRQELTDYAVSILKESNENAGQSEQAAAMVERAARNDPFNPIAFAIPLLVIRRDPVRDGNPGRRGAGRDRDRIADGDLGIGRCVFRPLPAAGLSRKFT